MTEVGFLPPSSTLYILYFFINNPLRLHICLLGVGADQVPKKWLEVWSVN